MGIFSGLPNLNPFGKKSNAIVPATTNAPAPAPAPATPVPTGGGLTASYKGGSYKVRKGPQGGKYIVVKGKKVYINKKK
jgi:hypothetical protein